MVRAFISHFFKLIFTVFIIIYFPCVAQPRVRPTAPPPPGFTLQFLGSRWGAGVCSPPTPHPPQPGHPKIWGGDGEGAGSAPPMGALAPNRPRFLSHGGGREHRGGALNAANAPRGWGGVGGVQPGSCPGFVAVLLGPGSAIFTRTSPNLPRAKTARPSPGDLC